MFVLPSYWVLVLKVRDLFPLALCMARVRESTKIRLTIRHYYKATTHEYGTLPKAARVFTEWPGMRWSRLILLQSGSSIHWNMSVLKGSTIHCILFGAYWMMQMKSTCTNLNQNIIFCTTLILMLRAFQMHCILSTHSSRDTISALNRLESKNVTKKGTMKGEPLIAFRWLLR